MGTNQPYVTREDIVNFSFPYKLWLIVNLECCEFLRWNRDGTVMALDLVALEEYLNSTRSIFKIKNCSQFLQHLEEFKFERLNALPEPEEDLVLQYKNENFRRHRLDLLAKVRRHTLQPSGKVMVDSGHNVNHHFTSERVSERMLGDLCFMSHGGLSKIKESRIRFQTMLHFFSETRILEEKLQASELPQRHMSNPDVFSRSAIGNASSTENQIIELPFDLFENPYDSVLNLVDFRPDYAGYYGTCNRDQITRFFGDCLPKYEDGSMEMKQVLINNETVYDNIPITNAEPNAMQYYLPNIFEDTYVSTSTYMDWNSPINLNLSSKLQPIFKVNKNYESNKNNYDNNIGCIITEANVNNFDNEADMSMEEFIKFKDIPNEHSGEKFQVNNDSDSASGEQKGADAFPQMPAAVKIEITEDVNENESNFRNFFRLYKTSLNLLYERR